MKAGKSSHPKKPIHVVHIMDNAEQGGVGAVLISLLKGMNKDDFKQSVIIDNSKGAFSTQFDANACKTIYIRDTNGRWSIADAKEALGILKDADVINFLARKASLGFIPSLLRKPAVWDVHSTIENKNSLDPRAYYMHRLTSRVFADRIVCCTERSLDDHARVYGYDPAAMEVIHNGIDTDVFKPDAKSRDAIRKELSIAHDAPVIVMSSRYDAEKGIETLIEAMNGLVQEPKFSKAQLILCGKQMDEKNPALMECIKKYGLQSHVHTLGYRGDIASIYAASDIVALPSHGEALPLCVLEGMATGCLPVATRVGDLPRVFKPVNGRFVEMGDPISLKQGLAAELSLPPGERANKSDAMREHIIAQYGLEQMIVGYEKLFSEVASRRARRPQSAAML